jgi:hypothetical protein
MTIIHAVFLTQITLISQIATDFSSYCALAFQRTCGHQDQVFIQRTKTITKTSAQLRLRKANLRSSAKSA